MRGSIAAVILLALLAAAPSGASGAGPSTLAPRFSIYSDEKGGGMSHPEGVACSDNALVVSDSGNGRLIRYALQGGDVKGGTEIRLPELHYPTRLQMSSKGEVLALDGRQRRIIMVGESGAFAGYVEPRGLPFSGGVAAESFKLDAQDNIYILDVVSGKAVVLGPDGRYIRHTDLPKGAQILDLAVNRKGDIFAVDAVNAVVYVARNGSQAFEPFIKPLKQYMNFPAVITLDERGFIYLADRFGSGITMLGPDGSFQGQQLGMGWSEGQIYYPAGICLGPEGLMFIADMGNNRVGVFGPAK